MREKKVPADNFTIKSFYDPAANDTPDVVDERNW